MSGRADTSREMSQMQRLTVMLSPRDHSPHDSLATEVIGRARRAGLAGATLFQAVEAHGQSRAVHRQHLVSDDIALSVVIIDEESKITPFVVAIREVIGESLVIVEDVTAYRV